MRPASGEKRRRFPLIERRELPTQLPTVDAIRSWGQTIHDYHPDAWDLDYLVYEYLSGMTDEGIVDRYRYILRSMKTVSHKDRHCVPINSYLGSWYWYRKEHQTRLEMAARGLEIPSDDSVPSPRCDGAPVHIDLPDGAKAIFRYGDRGWLTDLVRHGRLRVRPASYYENTGHNEARRDKELEKSSYLAGKYSSIVLPDGRRIPPRGDIKKSVSGPDYHLSCFSSVWDENLFSDFAAEACVVISDPESFERRLEKAAARIFPARHFFAGPVGYVDPYRLGKNEAFGVSYSKDFRFCYQWEYRFLWLFGEGTHVDGDRDIVMGSLEDVARLYDREGNEIAT